jgi:hypothetical protein
MITCDKSLTHNVALWSINEVWVLFTDRHHEKHILVLPEGYYASPKRIVKALEAMKHQKGMKKGFSLGMSEVDHKATLCVRDLSQVIISPLLNLSPRIHPNLTSPVIV